MIPEFFSFVCRYYHIRLSSLGGFQWWLNRTSTDGDCDLYIRNGTYPDRANFLKRNVTTVANKQIIMSEVAAGTYYAGAYGYRTCSYDIVVNVVGSCPSNCNGHGTCITGCLIRKLFVFYSVLTFDQGHAIATRDTAAPHVNCPSPKS